MVCWLLRLLSIVCSGLHFFLNKLVALITVGVRGIGDYFRITSDITYSSVYDCRIRFLNLAENFHKLIMKMIKAIC